MHQVLSVPHPVKVMSGKSLAHRLHKATPGQKAQIAVELQLGIAAVDKLTAAQAKAPSGAKAFHIKQARDGIKPAVRDRAAQVRRIERMIDRIVEMGGAELLYARIDEMTTPKVVG